MLTRRLFISLLMISAVFITSCQQRDTNRRQRIGRSLRGPVAYDQYGNPRPYNSTAGTALWGEVTGTNQQSFNDELYFFAMPSLANAPAEDQLGFVSAQSGQQTGVALWGQVFGISSQGQMDGQNSKIHIEVYDDRYGTQRSDGSTREQLVVHIGADQQGFVRAYGNLQQGLYFEDSYGSVMLRGSVQGQYFVGDLYYANQNTGGQRRLGRFTIPAQGFFFN